MSWKEDFAKHLLHKNKTLNTNATFQTVLWGAVPSWVSLDEASQHQNPTTLDWTSFLFLVILLGVSTGTCLCCHSLRGVHNQGHQRQKPTFPKALTPPKALEDVGDMELLGGRDPLLLSHFTQTALNCLHPDHHSLSKDCPCQPLDNPKHTFWLFLRETFRLKRLMNTEVTS